MKIHTNKKSKTGRNNCEQWYSVTGWDHLLPVIHIGRQVEKQTNVVASLLSSLSVTNNLYTRLGINEEKRI